MSPAHPALHVFADTGALCSSLRRYILAAQTTGLARHSTFKIAVSGGSLPSQLATALLDDTDDTSATPLFDKWEIFFADERCVPLDHADSTYALLKTALLDRIPAALGSPRVHTIDPTVLADPPEAADRYEKGIIASFASRDSVRLPAFDLILLGCGPDGHTCSLFPGHPLLRERDAWVAPIEDSPKPPSCRITLTLPVIAHAHQAAFVAAGEAKRDVLARIFDGAEKSEELPCALVNRELGDRCSWFIDDKAAQGLQYPRRGAP